MDSNSIENFLKACKTQFKRSKSIIGIRIILGILTPISALFTNLTVSIIICVLYVAFEYIGSNIENSQYETLIEKLNNEHKNEIENLKDEKNKIITDLERTSYALENGIRQATETLFSKLDLTFSDRVSIYYKDKENDHFNIVARHSLNGGNAKFGRDKYPSDVGYISQCWSGTSDSFYTILNNIGTQKYYEDHNKVGMEKNDVDAMSMKSKVYYVKNINKKGKTSIGVMVLESTSDNIGSYKDKVEIDTAIEKHIDFIFDILDNGMRGVQ